MIEVWVVGGRGRHQVLQGGAGECGGVYIDHSLVDSWELYLGGCADDNEEHSGGGFYND